MGLPGSKPRGQAFFVVQPEIAGARVSGTGPSAVCVFDTWLGDDLVRVHPALLVTAPLMEALTAIDGSSGFTVTRAQATPSPFWRLHSPDKRLPDFWYLQAQGAPGRDDVGATADGSIVISWRVLDVLAGFQIRRAIFAQYSPTTMERAARQAVAADEADAGLESRR